jgi:hypothetical protein
MASVYEDVLTAVKNRIISIGLDGISASNVTIRMLPKIDETIDPLPSILVSPIVPESYPYGFFHDSVIVRYAADIVIVAANNNDLSTNLGAYLQWRESLRRKFQTAKEANIPGVFNATVSPMVMFDRAALAGQYAYMGFRLAVEVVEDKT